MSKKKITAAVILLALLGVLLTWFVRSSSDISNRELESRLARESATIQAKIDTRYEQLDEKLTRIEAKLDRLLDLATNPRLPDNMQPAGF